MNDILVGIAIGGFIGTSIFLLMIPVIVKSSFHSGYKCGISEARDKTMTLGELARPKKGGIR